MTTEDAPPLTRRARRARLRAAAAAEADPDASPGTARTGADPVSEETGAPEDAAAPAVPEEAADRDTDDTTDDTTDDGWDDAPRVAPPRPVPASSVIAASALPTPPVTSSDSTPEEPAPDEPRAATTPAPTEAAPAEATPVAAAPRRVALGWVDEDAVAAASPAVSLATAASPYTTVQTDLLDIRPRRSPLRASVLVPVLSVVAVVALYVLTTLLWPLHALPPQVAPATFGPLAAPAAAPAWPEQGSAALGVDGITGTVASSPDASSIASLTKVVTSLMILEEMPLAPGEQGPEYRFTSADQSEYWAYRERGESALPVPVDGTLTQFQMLQGILIASANNYADRLASELWPSDRVFADAAESWLAQQGLTGITIVDPSGIGDDNAAEPAALIALAERAMANPVIAEIVRMPSAELPGAGLIENTNALLADPGVVGVKTGALWQHFNLLVAKDIVVGETPVRLYASILGQFDGEERNVAARELLAQLEAQLQQRPTVTAGTIAGVVTTAWGEQVDIVTSADASVVLWNSAVGEVTTDLTVGDDREAQSLAGSLTVTGPLDTQTVDVRLADTIEGPSAWWRLTHPLELFGLAG